MKVIDERLLKSIRAMPCCWCGRPGPSEAHHLFGKGMGGWGRMDVSLNLAPLCRLHHQSFHDGNQPMFNDLIALTASRCGVRPELALDELYALRRTGRGYQREAVGEAGGIDAGDHDGSESASLRGRGTVAAPGRGPISLPAHEDVEGDL